MLKTFPNSTKFLKSKLDNVYRCSTVCIAYISLLIIMILAILSAIVSFGNVNPEQKEEVGKHGVAIYSWDEFLLLVRFTLFLADLTC